MFLRGKKKQKLNDNGANYTKSKDFVLLALIVDDMCLIKHKLRFMNARTWTPQCIDVSVLS